MTKPYAIAFDCPSCGQALAGDSTLICQPFRCTHCAVTFELQEFRTAVGGREVSFKMPETTEPERIGTVIGRHLWEAALTAYKQPKLTENCGLKKKLFSFNKLKDPLFSELLYLEFFVVFMGITTASASSQSKDIVTKGVRNFLLEKLEAEGGDRDLFMGMHRRRLTQYDSAFRAMMDESNPDNKLLARDILCDALQRVVDDRSHDSEGLIPWKIMSYFSSRVMDGAPMISNVLDEYLPIE